MQFRSPREGDIVLFGRNGDTHGFYTGIGKVDALRANGQASIKSLSKLHAATNNWSNSKEEWETEQAELLVLSPEDYKDKYAGDYAAEYSDHEPLYVLTKRFDEKYRTLKRDLCDPLAYKHIGTFIAQQVPAATAAAAASSSSSTSTPSATATSRKRPAQYMNGNATAVLTSNGRPRQAMRTNVWKKRHPRSQYGSCYCCGRTIEISNFEAGHIRARANGGQTELENLEAICHECNKSMGTQNLDDFKKFFEKKKKE